MTLTHWPMSQQTRQRFAELTDRAQSLGISRDGIANAGPVALRALLALKNAAESEAGPRRDHYLRQVQDALRVLEHRSHPELVQQFQARILALQGRGADTEVAHVARGEMVVPRALQNQDVMKALSKAATRSGIPLEMLSVGSTKNRINPETGMPEFGVVAQQVFNAYRPLNEPSLEMLENSVIPNVNSTDATAPPLKDFNFDPNGPSEFGAMLRDPFGAVVAGLSALEAKARTALRYPDGGSRNNEADAFKHAMWNRRMADLLGPERAKAFGDAHEVSGRNSPEEQAMDLYNNRIARNLPLEKSAREEVDDAFKKGYFRTSPFPKD